MERDPMFMNWKTVKTAVLSKLCDRFNSLSIKILATFFFAEITKLILKFLW